MFWRGFVGTKNHRYHRKVENRWTKDEEFAEQQEARRVNGLPLMKIKHRKCLSCEKGFKSQGYRICDSCYEEERERNIRDSYNHKQETEWA